MRYDTSLIIIHLLIYIYTTLHGLLCQLSRTDDLQKDERRRKNGRRREKRKERKPENEGVILLGPVTGSGRLRN